MFKRILKALFALFFGQVLTRFGSFILVPLFTKYWSATIYGEWLTLSAAVAYIASLDFGVNQAAINRLTQTYAAGNLEEYKSIQHSALKFFLFLALVGFIIFSLLLGFIPINKLLGIASTPPSEASFTLLILSAYILTSLPARMIFSIYQTTGDLAKTQWIQNAQSILFLLFSVLILLQGYGMIYVAALQFLLQILAVIFVLIDAKLKYPALFPGFKFAENKMVKELFKPGLLFMLIIFANIIWYQGSVLLISSTFGGLLVATFSVSRTLSLLPRQIVSMFYAAVFPDIAILKGKKDYENLRLIHRLLIIISTGLAIVFFSLFWFSGSQIIKFWTLGEIEPDLGLLHALLILVLLQTPYLSSAAITLATNQHKVYTILFFLSQLVGFILSFSFINEFGIIILPISFVLSETLFCFYFVIKDTCVRIDENYSELFMSSIINTVIILSGSMLVVWLIFKFLNFSFIFNIILSLVLTFVLVSFYIWKIWLKKNDRQFLKEKIKFGLWQKTI